MEIRSLSYSTLLHQLSYSSKITDKGTHLVISTPGLPFYEWGNFLMFPGPPVAGDSIQWEALYRGEFKKSGCTHMAFAWDSASGESGEIQAFTEDGYYFEYDDILTTKKAIRPNNYNDEMKMRVLQTDDDWERRAELNLACGDTLDRIQLVQLGAHYRSDAQKDRGVFLGAFLKSELVGEMALFRGGEDYGLISLVKTHPDFRATGICRTLLYHVVQFGIELFQFKEFVLVADKAGIAASVYQSVGFEVVEQGASLIKRN